MRLLARLSPLLRLTGHQLLARQSTSSAPLIITEKCVRRLKAICDQGEHLRLSVDGGGCSGFEYKISLDRRVNPDDRVFEQDGVKVLVDEVCLMHVTCNPVVEMSMAYVQGATVDFVDDLMRSAFRVVKNPIAEKGCSCGSSFAPRMD